jgi:hypothetical protein
MCRLPERDIASGAPAGPADAPGDGMPGVFILVTFPTLLLGAILIIQSLALSGAAAVSVVLLIALVGVVFVSLVVTMLHQHPSQDGGDRRQSEDRMSRVEDSLELDAIPAVIVDADDVRADQVDRWDDDGGWHRPADPR